jgi:hypothetical protein
MAKNPNQQTSPMRFESMRQTDVPKGRDGKHKAIMQQLLSDLNHLEEGNALKIPLSALPDSKENIRSALSRATRQKGIDIATSSDEEFLYVWRTEANSTASGNGNQHRGTAR